MLVSNLVLTCDYILLLFESALKVVSNFLRSYTKYWICILMRFSSDASFIQLFKQDNWLQYNARSRHEDNNTSIW
jgi:hypothetical protein